MMKQPVIAMLLTAFLLGPVFVSAEGKSKGGDEFRATAMKYDKKSEMYSDKGMPEVASLYARQAEIKRKAGKMGDEGRWDEIDWTEYHANEAKINGLVHKKNKYAKSHKKYK